MTDEEQNIKDAAIKFIKSHRKDILNQFCPQSICYPADNPISLFMAGSPGAGKTEVSKGFIRDREFKNIPMRIDADEIRAQCPDYFGTNAHLFQEAANKGVNILYDYALAKSVNCIMDGTFAYGGAVQNIERSLRRGRKIKIWFIYQDPIRAWEVTKAREAREARRVSKEVFINAFFKSRANVRIVKELFGREIELNILIKDYESKIEDFWMNVSTSELDRIITSIYSIETLTNVLV